MLGNFELHAPKEAQQQIEEVSTGFKPPADGYYLAAIAGVEIKTNGGVGDSFGYNFHVALCMSTHTTTRIREVPDWDMDSPVRLWRTYQWVGGLNEDLKIVPGRTKDGRTVDGAPPAFTVMRYVGAGLETKPDDLRGRLVIAQAQTKEKWDDPQDTETEVRIWPLPDENRIGEKVQIALPVPDSMKAAAPMSDVPF